MKAGIITFHGAYNYGAVLQAYALQQFLLSLNIECEIINFRTRSQMDFNSLYPKRNGVKSILKNLLMLKYDSERRDRKNLFEKFINENLYLTKNLYETEKNLYELNNIMDVFITGSDQIWNTNKKADINKAYFLNFVDSKKNKIAYAASIGSAKKKDLLSYSKYIKRINSVSCRERGASKVISEIINKDIPTVLDPTLLVEKDIFEKLIQEEKIRQKDYILYYSLDGFDKRNNNVAELKMLQKKLNKKVVILTPEWPKRVTGFENIIDAGPVDFLLLIKNATLVCTNSFHGTALSICFRKDFYVLDNENIFDDRKTSLLEQLGLCDRIVKGEKTMKNLIITSVLYDKVELKLRTLREHSISFLKNSLYKEF